MLPWQFQCIHLFQELYSYDYTINILGKDLNRYGLSIVLERNEEKELIKFLKDKNIEVILKYYDNKHDGD